MTDTTDRATAPSAPVGGVEEQLRPVHWRRWAVLSSEGECRRICLTEGDACETACGDEDVQEVAVYPVNAPPPVPVAPPPVLTATEDHPAIYKDGHRLVAGKRLDAVPVAPEGAVAWHLHPSVTETARQLHRHLATANRSAQWLNEAYELCQRLGDAVSAVNSAHPLPPSDAPSGPNFGSAEQIAYRWGWNDATTDRGLAHNRQAKREEGMRVRYPDASPPPDAGRRGEVEVNLAINAYDDAKARTAYNLRYNFSPAQVEEDKRNEEAARAALLALCLPAPAAPQRADVEAAMVKYARAYGAFKDYGGTENEMLLSAAKLDLLSLWGPEGVPAHGAGEMERDAKLWRWFRERAWVGTTEDSEIFLSTLVGEPADVECLTDAERELFENDSPDAKDMSSLCQRIAEWHADIPTPSAPREDR